jgi:hypothetical protein
MKDVNYPEQQLVALYFNLATQKAERRGQDAIEFRKRRKQ